MLKENVLKRVSDIIEMAKIVDCKDDYSELITYIEGLHELISLDNGENDIKVSILSQIMFIVGYCRALKKVTDDINWALLENDIELVGFDYIYARDIMWDEY